MKELWLVWLPISFLNLLDFIQECFINDFLASLDNHPGQHSARLLGVWFGLVLQEGGREQVSGKKERKVMEFECFIHKKLTRQ